MSKYKHGKQKKTLSPEDFSKIMEKGHFAKPIHKGFLVLLYYTGCRVSEIIKLVREDFLMKPHMLVVDIQASKKGVDRPAFILPRNLPHMECVFVDWIQTKKGARVYPFSRQTAWNIVKRVMPEHYPHYFRLNRVVNMLDQEKPKNKIRIWFGWKRWATVENYLGYSKAATKGLSEDLE